jgi:hypothetical protein
MVNVKSSIFKIEGLGIRCKVLWLEGGGVAAVKDMHCFFVIVRIRVELGLGFGIGFELDVECQRSGFAGKRSGSTYLK